MKEYVIIIKASTNLSVKELEERFEKAFETDEMIEGFEVSKVEECK
jgi:hypothetical protein